MPPFTWRNSFCLRVYFICYSHRHSSSHRVVVCVIYLFHPFLSLFASHVSCRQRAYAGTPWSYRCARRRNKASPTNFCFLVPLVARTCTAAPGRKPQNKLGTFFECPPGGAFQRVCWGSAGRREKEGLKGAQFCQLHLSPPQSHRVGDSHRIVCSHLIGLTFSWSLDCKRLGLEGFSLVGCCPHEADSLSFWKREKWKLCGDNQCSSPTLTSKVKRRSSVQMNTVPVDLLTLFPWFPARMLEREICL